MGFLSKIKDGLKKTRDSVFKRVKNLLKFEKLNDETIEEIEELLLLSDMGSNTVDRVITELKEKIGSGEDPAILLENILESILDIPARESEKSGKPYVISVVGVNGTGKTTTIGKLSKIFNDQGKKVVLAACDTFRAAAVEQLKIWSERSGVDIISHGQGADSAAVAFDAVGHAVS